MSKTKTPTIKSTSVPSAYDTPLTTLEYLRKVQEQNAQVLARADEIEEALADKVAKSGDTMTGALNVPQVNADTGVFHHLDAVSQDGNTHAEVSNGGFIAEVTEETTGNKKYGVIAYPNGKVGFYAHDALHNKDVNFIIPNMDDYEAGTYELATKDDIPSGGSSLLEDIEDEDGHKRFFNLNGAKGADTDTYFDTFSAVASLSGYHLMIVLLMTKKNEPYVDAEKEIAVFDLPSWIYDKIISLSNNGIVMRNTTTIYSDNASLSTTYYLKKENGQLKVRTQSRDSMTGYIYVRSQFDLYIE